MEHSFSTKVGRSMLWIVWISLITLLTWYYHTKLNQQSNPNQNIRAQYVDGAQQILLQRNKYGHYMLNGQVNGINSVFLVDTGATYVALPLKLAAQLHLSKQHLMTFHTANGVSQGYYTTIKTLDLAGIQLHDVPAILADNLSGDEILLGMSALKFFDFSQRNKQLTLTFNPNH